MYLNIIYKKDNCIRFSKESKKGNVINFDEINLNEWDLYKASNRFKLINGDEIGKYSNYLLIKKEYHHYSDEFIKWYNKHSDLNLTYMIYPITFNPWDIKIIETTI